MHVLYFVLALVALVCFGAAAFGVSTRRVNLMALGLALFTLITVLQLAQRL